MKKLHTGLFQNIHTRLHCLICHLILEILNLSLTEKPLDMRGRVAGLNIE